MSAQARQRVVLPLALWAASLVLGCGSGDVRDPADTEEPPPDGPPPITAGFRAIWGASASDVWAVGEAGVIAHFDGEGWMEVESPTDRALQAVHGTSATDAWAVGEDVVLRWDGTIWSEVLRDMAEVLLGVWSGGPDEVWAAGIATDVGLGLLRHWDGSGWDWGIPPTAKTLWDVWGSAGGGVWTGGTATTGAGYLIRGALPDAMPPDQGPSFDLIGYEGDSLRAIWGTDSSDVWIATYQGPFQHWDGAVWSVVERPSDVGLIGLGGTARDDAWAVGLSGAVLHWDGSAWTDSLVETSVTLASVWAAAPDDAWIAGAAGTLLHWDGATWRARNAAAL